MALLTPNTDEEREDFISRCMGDEKVKEEFPDEDQRLAVCNAQFNSSESQFAIDRLNTAGANMARRLLREGKVNKDSPWSFSAEDGNKLLGSEGDDFVTFGSMHLGIDTSANEGTKDRFGFPFGKLVGETPTLFRSALIAIRQRAGQQDLQPLFDVAGELLEKIDGKEMGTGEKKEERMQNKEEELHGSLNDVEIFRTGKWKGDIFTTKDLDDIVEAFARVGFRPPIKLGHAEKSGDPAFGWVASIKRLGDRLVADFVDLPKEVFQAIKQKRFNAVSSEIFFNLERGGQKFRRALKAVALLGAEIPAVAGLKPLSECFSDLSYDKVFTIDEDDEMADEKTIEELKTKLAEMQNSVKEKDTAMAELNEQIKQFKAANKDAGNKDKENVLQYKEMQEQIVALQQEITQAKDRERQAIVQGKLNDIRVPVLRDHFFALYSMAIGETKTVKFKLGEKEQDLPLVAVLDDLVKRINKASEKLFAEQATAGDFRRDDVTKGEDPGKELDSQAKKYAAEKKTTYFEAFNHVLNDPENAELKKAYAARTV